jgi:uncharacterized membrane protein YbhN (UPF0104 family)
VSGPPPKLLRRLGNLLAVLGCLFVGIQIFRYGSELELGGIAGEYWWFLAGCALVYGAANAALAIAWMYLLRHCGDPVAPRTAMAVYGVTLPAKYLPGNILHLAGRQALGVDRGIGGWALAKASIWELALVLAGGLLFAILVAPRFTGLLAASQSVLLFGASALAVLLLLGITFGRLVARAFLLHLVFLGTSAATFIALLWPLAQGDTVLREFPLLAGAFILAWSVGLVTPGAPAGAGVRELVLIGCLEGLVAQTAMLEAVLLSRLVTVLGDLLFFAAVQLFLCGRDRAVTTADRASQ